VVRQIVPDENLPGGGQGRREVRRILFTSDREFLSTGDDAIVRIWRESQGDWSQMAKLNHGEVCERASADACNLAPAAEAGSEAQQSGGGVSTTGAYAFAVSPCGRFLACAGRGRHRAVTLWNIENRAEPAFVAILSHRVGKNRRGFHSLHFSIDGKHLWAAGWDESIVRWDTATVGAPPSLVRYEALVSTCEKGPDENSLMVGTGSGKVRLLQVQGIPR
jgi:WD40 repeat protein